MTSSPGEQARSQVRPSVIGGTGNLSRPPVMADVARLAGVSHQTVSRVLNEHPNVRPLTRERVLAAIRELAYRPNAAARTLVTRRTHTLGVITADTMLYGPTSMLYGFERAAHDTYFVSVASLSVTSVAIDNMAGAAAATRYLFGLGHQTVYHVAGPSSCLDAKERVDGWRQAVREAGAPEPAVLAGDWSAASGYELGGRLAAQPALTAVFCGNDTMALGVIRALTERGLRVPEDISIVGFDDVPEAGFYLPPLTTVRQDFGELGRRALRTLVDRMSGAIPGGRRVRVAPELIVRASAAGPG